MLRRRLKFNGKHPNITTSADNQYKMQPPIGNGCVAENDPTSSAASPWQLRRATALFGPALALMDM